MKTILRFAPVLAAGVLVACGGASAPAPAAIRPDGLDPQARGQAALKDFGDRLRTELRETMTRDGAPAAVDFCHVQAPRIAGQVMAEHGVRLGRVAVPGRNRNPGNVAEGWLQELAVSFQAAVDTGGAPEAQMAVIREDVPAGVELRMARGIRVEAACLMCHGDNIAPGIAARLAKHYPRDRATGFKEGDLRGLIWAEVPANPGTTP